MSDIIVLDKADEAITFTGSAVTDLDGLLSGVPGLIESVPALVTDLVDHIAVSVVPGLDLDLNELLDLDNLDESLDHVLGIVPGTVGGVLGGLALHLDGTVDVVTDQTLGVTAALGPVLEPVAEIVSQITATLGVTDELPARLQALAGIAIVGSDSVLSNLSEILDATLGLGLGDLVDHTLSTVVAVADDLTVSLGLGSLVDVAEVGITSAPMTAEGTTDESAGAGHGLLGSLVADADGVGEHVANGSVVLGVQGLVHAVPSAVDSTVDVVLDDSLGLGLSPVVGQVTGTVDALLADPTALDLGAEVDQTLGTVDTFVDDSAAGLGLSLDLGGLG